MATSFVFYIHSDLSKVSDIWKIGKAITPYTAVRARQKYMSEKFYLDYLFFGDPTDIANLENHIKSVLKSRLVNTGCQTELFRIPINELLNLIKGTIETRDLRIKEIVLKEKYSACNSSSCPLGFPSEQNAYNILIDKVDSEFSHVRPVASIMFGKFFEYDF